MINASKNYYRDELMDLIGKTNRKPILFSGKFKYCPNKRYITFTCIRPTIPNKKTKTICNHLNFTLEEATRFHTFSEEVHNRKFYIIGHPSIYLHLGEMRGGVKLDHSLGIPAIFIVDELEKYMTDEIKEKIYYPSDFQKINVLL